jgi:hypothetical protein
MNANCVNVLNRTVSDVCNLDKKINRNKEDIEFLLKYMDFTKNLQLAYLGCDVQILSSISSFYIQPLFINNNLIKFYLLGILEYLNNQNKENYYFIANNNNDIPFFFQNNEYKFPCIVEVGLIYCDKYKLTSIIDSTKTQDFSILKDIIDYLQTNLEYNIPQYFLGIIEFLINMPDIYLQTYTTKYILSNRINSIYSSLQETKKENKKVFTLLINKYHNNYLSNNIIESITFFIKKASDTLYIEYKQKSFNNPFIEQPTQTNIFEKAHELFMKFNNLDIDNNSGEPNEPNEPNEPREPREPNESNDNIINLIHSNYNSNNINDGNIHASLRNETFENKLKLLLEMTESETSFTF